MFGGFALRANSLGHMEQIDSYAPGHQIRFGNLNYTKDIRGDLIFDGFGPAPGASNSHDEHGLDLLSDNARDITPVVAPNLNLEHTAWPKDGWMDLAPQAAHSLAIEPNTGLTSKEAYDSGPPDSYPVVGSGPRAPKPAELGWALVMEFTAADIFQHSPFGDMLNSLKSLSLSGDSWPNYVRLEWEAGDEGIRCPPTTHFIATVDDLTDVLDFNFEDIDGLDNDVGEKQEPPPTGRWTATSSYDIYMVDTPKETNGDEAMEDNPSKKKAK